MFAPPNSVAYEYQEYPKMVTFPDGKYKIVQSAEEEEIVIGEIPKIATFNDVLTVKEEVISDDKFKVILLKIAEKFEITIDKRWKLEKLADAILATKEEILTEDEK